MAITTFAAIDVGSQETSISIYEISKKFGIRQLDHIYHTVSLGAESYNYGKISNQTVEQLCSVLTEFTLKMKEYGTTDYTALATSALREAANNIIVLEQIRLRSGLKVKILSNSEQRFLCYKAIALKENAFHKLIQKGTAIVDVGGGRMQISIFNKESLVLTQSFTLGPLRMREALETLQNQNGQYETLLFEYIYKDLHTFCEQYLQDIKIKNIIAVGNHLHYFSDYLTRFSKDIIDPIDSKGRKKDGITKKEFHNFYTTLSGRSVEMIASALNITYEEASLILPTTMIYHSIFEETGAELMWLSGITLSDGMAAEFAEKKEKILPAHSFTDDILSSAKSVAMRYQSSTAHSNNVEFIALKLFDALKKRYSLGRRDRLLLQIATILHNCGSYINLNETRENSYKIIMSTEIIGLSHIEREAVAHLVRYDTGFPDYQTLSDTFDRDAYIKIAKLNAILRLANAMDRSHRQKFKKITAVLKDNILTVTGHTLQDISMEQNAFLLKADFFEEVFGITPVLKQKKTN